jgi:hypothetical protein
MHDAPPPRRSSAARSRQPVDRGCPRGCAVHRAAGRGRACGEGVGKQGLDCRRGAGSCMRVCWAPRPPRCAGSRRGGGGMQRAEQNWRLQYKAAHRKLLAGSDWPAPLRAWLLRVTRSNATLAGAGTQPTPHFDVPMYTHLLGSQGALHTGKYTAACTCSPAAKAASRRHRAAAAPDARPSHRPTGQPPL